MPLTEKISDFAKIYCNTWGICCFCPCWDIYFFEILPVMSSKLKYRETLNYSEVRCILNWLVALSGRQFDRTSTINIRFSPTILSLQHILLPLFHRGLRRHERGGNRRQLFGSFSLIKIQLSQPRPQAFVRYRVTEEGLEPSAIAIKAKFLFLSSSSDDVTFDYAPRKTGNEAEPSNFWTLAVPVDARRNK